MPFHPKLSPPAQRIWQRRRASMPHEKSQRHLRTLSQVTHQVMPLKTSLTRGVFLAQNTDSDDDDDDDMVDAGSVSGDSSCDSSPSVTTQHNDRSKHSPAPEPASTAHVRSAPGLTQQDSRKELAPPAAISARSAVNICPNHELDSKTYRILSRFS